MAANISTYIIVIVLVIIAIVAIDFLLNYVISLRTSKTSTTTAVTSNGVATTVNSVVTTVANYSNVTTGCLSNNVTEALLNGNFSSGNFEGWNVTGQGFGSAPVNIIYANANGDYYSAPWSGYNGIFFATTHWPGTSVTPGNITSEPFKVTEPYLNFQIVSPQDNELYVELLDNGQPLIINHYFTFPAVANATNAQSTFVNASIPIASLICQNISVRVVSGVVGQRIGNYKFIAVGDFYMSKVFKQDPGVIYNRTVV